jgi:hypothetical protein
MTFALPAFTTLNSPAQLDPFMVLSGVESEAYLAGIDQWYAHLGSRFGANVTLPPMEHDVARMWIGALLRAYESGEEVTMEWMQPGFDPGAPGNLYVDETSSANARVIAVRDADSPSDYVAKQGQFFNLTKGGRKYLHVVGQTGTASLIISPALRLGVVDGDPLDFATPSIQGRISGEAKGWTVNAAHLYGVSFTIKERK